MCDTHRKLVKDGKSHKLAEVTVASRHPGGGKTELDGQTEA